MQPAIFMLIILPAKEIHLGLPAWIAGQYSAGIFLPGVRAL
ncbi:hypothetical protein DCCM_3766 [Desulfocucumis palustris]|uniref:Uncharacterized protein n=1 Tax=Desulfocucumis palustris TaxID=1898651 RepID=A0A2L2XK33_9FIRM|nr:hypothetical protein DCCM_3766 [Desulfocucumis palustris]